MTVKVIGNEYDATVEPADGETPENVIYRASLAVELWNRDNPEDPRSVEVTE